MKFITLTAQSEVKSSPILVNPEQVVSVRGRYVPGNRYEGSVITLTRGDELTVAEDLEEVAAQVESGRS